MIAGQLPSSWGKLLNLQEVSLSNNALTGTVPAKLAKLVSLLDVSRNQLLCGRSPDSPALVATSTSIGQDCSMMVLAARLSGTRGVILGEHCSCCSEFDHAAAQLTGPREVEKA